MIEQPQPVRKLWPLFLSALLLTLSALGALREVRRMDAVESPHINSVANAVWRSSAPNEATLELGSFRVPAGGSARVMLCARAALSGALRVTEGGGTHRAALSADDTRSGAGRHCYTAHWRAPSAHTIAASLAITARGAAPTLERLDASAGAVITVWRAWPMLLLLLAIALFALSPRPAPSKEALAQPDETFTQPAFPSRVLAIVALVGAQILGQLPVGLMGFGSVSLLVGLFVQHGAMVLFSAALLGALSLKDRKPLPFGVVAPDKLARVLVSAMVLLAIAVGVGYLVHDAADTPLGQVLERVPLRYVIALGALLAPLPEELFFRGVLVDAFSRRGKVVGVWVAALIFTGMHAPQLWGSPVALVPIALVGIVNGYLRVYTGSLTAPWIVHTLYNTALASSVLLDG